MAQTFRQRIAQAEAMARADMLRFQPEVLVQLLFPRFCDLVQFSSMKRRIDFQTRPGCT